MDLNNFGVMNAVIFIRNSHASDPSHAIASFLLPKIREIDRLSVQDVMDGAFVSRSAVRRFCSAIGYKNWSDFKASFSPCAFPSDLRHRDFTRGFEEYRSVLNERIDDALDDARACATPELVRELAGLICAREQVVILCHTNTVGVLVRFQQEMLYAGKYIDLYSDAYTGRESVSDDALIITVSVTGGFAATALDWVRQSPGVRVLVTANAAWEEGEAFDRVFLISSKRRDIDRLGAFGKYGIAYFFDLLSDCYLRELSDRTDLMTD